jgi:hypothetical protein
LHDIRGGWPLAHDANSYAHSQALAKKLRSAGSDGIVFDSVRHPSGQNIAVFRASVLAATRGRPHTLQGPHIRAEWDGARISRYIVLGESADWTTL